MNCRLIVVSMCIGLLQACASGGGGGDDVSAAQRNLELGAGYLRQGRIDLAMEPLERAIELDPRLTDGHRVIALAYEQQGDVERAETHYRRATQLDSANGATANSYGVFLCRQGRWADAEPYFRRAASSSDYAGEVALTNAGVCALDLGVAGDAERYFREALTRNAQFPDALSGMIELSYLNSEYLQARAFMQRYLEVGPTTAPLLLLCVGIEVELANNVAANRCASQLREGFPNSTEVARLPDYLNRNDRQ